MPDLPLLRRFPALRAIPRAPFGTFPTPVERVVVGTHALLLKRDDLSSAWIGGNKVRGLEWLLGPVAAAGAEAQVLTVGPSGSTHALATATLATRLGAGTTVVRWRQEMNPAAARVDVLLRQAARVIEMGWVGAAYAAATLLRARSRTTWIPAGGASPIALLGHVNAALELADQIERGELEAPHDVVVPFGTGGTAAGLALGFRIAGLRSRVIAVRVVPRLLGRRRRLLRLARVTAARLERLTGATIPRVRDGDILVEHGFYGGGYGRRLPTPADASALSARGVALDDTYSAKAYAAAIARRDVPTLLWLTFDGRLLQNEWPAADARTLSPSS